MSGEARPPIVIKRIKKVAGGHHGGSWKIAYADFVTAMMAFFLLMWLLGSTAKGDLHGIAEYFRTPLKVALGGGSGSGDSSSVIKGGGQNLTRTNGQVQKTDRPDKKRTINLQAAQAELARRELEGLLRLKGRVEDAITSNPKLGPFRNQIRLELTPEGLLIQIVDELNRPMFDSGRAVLKDYTRDILQEIGKLLNGVNQSLSIAGHTDAAPYALGERGYSNWELSADRANASRRELVAGGMDESKVLRVVGLSSSVPFNKADPLDPANRRISLLVLNKKTENAIRGMPEAPAVSVETPADAANALKPDEPAAGGETPAGAADAPRPEAPTPPPVQTPARAVDPLKIERPNADNGSN